MMPRHNIYQDGFTALEHGNIPPLEWPNDDVLIKIPSLSAECHNSSWATCWWLVNLSTYIGSFLIFNFSFSKPKFLKLRFRCLQPATIHYWHSHLAKLAHGGSRLSCCGSDTISAPWGLVVLQILVKFEIDLVLSRDDHDLSTTWFREAAAGLVWW